jgi:hypothetical protein
MLVLDSTVAAVIRRTEQEKNSCTPTPRTPLENSPDWLNREDFLAWSRRQKDAEFPVDYDV